MRFNSLIAASIGPGIIIPIIVLAIAAPAGFVWAKKLKTGGASTRVESPTAVGTRLTSDALRDLASPPWRIVYEITEEKLDGIEHVIIGPAGVFAVQTSMDPLPAPRVDPASAHEIARVAILRGGLDDALRRCAMTSDQLVTFHWGVDSDHRGQSVEVSPGAIAVDGRAIAAWAATLRERRLSPAQVDLAWQTVVAAIGRPDPLAT